MRLWAVICLMMVGCSSAEKSSSLDGAENAPSESGELNGEDGDSEIELEEPAAWELGGELVLDTDVIVEVESALNIRLLSAQRTVLCETVASIETATAMAPSQYPEDTLVGWWRVFVEESEPDGCFAQTYDFPVPVPMLLGIGPMHPEIAAAVGADIQLGAIDALNGAYASMDGGETLWVFGVIGTDDAYEGQSGPEESAPLSDGTWSIEPVYPFPL